MKILKNATYRRLVENSRKMEGIGLLLKGEIPEEHKGGAGGRSFGCAQDDKKRTANVKFNTDGTVTLIWVEERKQFDCLSGLVDYCRDNNIQAWAQSTGGKHGATLVVAPTHKNW